MNHSDQINELAAALAVAQSEIEGAVKGTTNPHFRTKYADLGAVWDAIRDPFTRNGLSITQLPSSGPPNALAIETVLMHKSGQWVSELFVMPVSKADPQGFGSALTYARRYSLMAVAGIAPVDDDAEGATDRRPPPKPEPKAETKTEPRTAPKPSPKAEITSGPMTPQTRTPEQWTRACEMWRDQIKATHSVTALNDLEQQLTETGELDALAAAHPNRHDFFMNPESGQFARRRAVLAAVETTRHGAMLRAG